MAQMGPHRASASKTVSYQRKRLVAIPPSHVGCIVPSCAGAQLALHVVPDGVHFPFAFSFLSEVSQVLIPIS